MRLYFICLAIILPVFHALSQKSYPVSVIPKPLLNKAGAVVRSSETIVEVKSRDHIIFREKTAITILNKSGEKESNISIWYNKSRNIKFIKGFIYNEFGLQVSKFTEKDFSDESAVSDFSLYEDSRIKKITVGLITYPYTIEYEYEVKIKQSLSFPFWSPLNATGISVENSSLTVIHPLDFKMRFKEINFNGVKDASQKDKKIIKWTVNNIQAIIDEPFSPDPQNFLTIVKMGPVDFTYDGISGNFSDWNEYGRWMNESLLKGREELALSTVFDIKELVKNIEDPKTKAKLIYEYMQKKTRYISVQIGIGGYQPYPATEVDRLGYGDCKGLSNYTKALLKVAEIESYYTIVNAGKFKEDISVDFASINDGNHVILCLPFPSDTLWLECTNQQIPFGYLGDFTDDRIVIACTPNGGKLMRTSRLDSYNNKQIRNASFIINDNGDLSGSIKTSFEGSQYDNHEILYGEPTSEQVKILAKMYPFPNLKVESIEYLQDKKELPVSEERIVVNSTKYAAVSTQGMLISLNLINKSTFVPKIIQNRINPVYINRGFHDYDEFVYKIPDGYKIDSYNNNVLVDKVFGSYKMEIIVNGKYITYKRSIFLREGTYPVAQYQELIEFYKTVREGDNSKVRLVKSI